MKETMLMVIQAGKKILDNDWVQTFHLFVRMALFMTGAPRCFCSSNSRHAS